MHLYASACTCMKACSCMHMHAHARFDAAACTSMHFYAKAVNFIFHEKWRSHALACSCMQVHQFMHLHGFMHPRAPSCTLHALCILSMIQVFLRTLGCGRSTFGRPERPGCVTPTRHKMIPTGKKWSLFGLFLKRRAWWVQPIPAVPAGRKWIGHIPKFSKILESLSETA